MTRKEAIKIMERWDAPGYAFDDGHEFGSFAKDNPKWWAALARADADVTCYLAALQKALGLCRQLGNTLSDAPDVTTLTERYLTLCDVASIDVDQEKV